MPINYTIDIDSRAVLVVVRQYDSAGNEVSISNIIVPESDAEQRRKSREIKIKSFQRSGAQVTQTVSATGEKMIIPEIISLMFGFGWCLGDIVNKTWSPENTLVMVVCFAFSAGALTKRAADWLRRSRHY